MARITKDADSRIAEILDTAYQFFNAKGYDKTSIDDIVQHMAVAKGTVYYYFKSKEDIFQALVERRCKLLINQLVTVAAAGGLSAIEKIESMLEKEYLWELESGTFLSHFHTWKNIENNQRSLIYLTTHYSPILAKVIQQGIAEGVFHTEYPLESSRLIMTGHRVLFDQTHFQWTEDELLQMAAAHQDVIECSLRAPKGSFSFIVDMVKQYLEKNHSQAEAPHGN